MSKYNLLALNAETCNTIITTILYAREEQPRVTLHPNSAALLQIDDKLLLAHVAQKSVVLPLVFRIVHINRATETVTVQLEGCYNYPVPLREAAEIIASSNSTVDSVASIIISLNRRARYVGIAQETFDAIITQMGGKRMEEKALLNYIQQYITARGYYFDLETLYNYHICLKTRPLVILAGLSGTGKSKLPQLYAEALGHEERFLRLAVRPNWNDDRYLLGYFNTLTNEFMTEAALDFVMEANEHEYDLHFFCLDEMNLAHVEHYFSQFLSAMEEEQPHKRSIRLYSERVKKQLEAAGKMLDIPPTVCVPPNLLFTGTINVDETTKAISDKVIDRANTLEFFSVDLDKIPPPGAPPDQLTLSALTWQSYRVHEPDTRYRKVLVEINSILNKMDIGLGYRVVREIELYLANSKGLLDGVTAFDLQVKQRILPRVRGPQTISEKLDELLAVMKREGLTRSHKRLEEMKRDGYTSFWR